MKENKGITLVPLIILIIIMLILLGVSVEVSRGILEKSKGEKLLANMKLIEIRANAYYEELDFKIGAKDFESYIAVNDDTILIKLDTELEKIEKNCFDMQEDYCCFIKWGKSELAKQGIDNTFLKKDDEYFIIAYNYNSHQVEEVYYNKGIYFDVKDIKDTDNKIYSNKEKRGPFYSLSDLEKEMSK